MSRILKLRDSNLPKVIQSLVKDMVGTRNQATWILRDSLPHWTLPFARQNLTSSTSPVIVQDRKCRLSIRKCKFGLPWHKWAFSVQEKFSFSWVCFLHYKTRNLGGLEVRAYEAAAALQRWSQTLPVFSSLALIEERKVVLNWWLGNLNFSLSSTFTISSSSTEQLLELLLGHLDF